MTKEQKKAIKLMEDSLNKKCNGLECKVVKNNIDLRLENGKLKRQIDLMTDYIATLDIEEDICANVENDNCDKMNFGECEDCIKRYFERKATNKG